MSSTLLDLLSVYDASRIVLPSSLREALESLVIREHETYTTDTNHVHAGVVQSARPVHLQGVWGSVIEAVGVQNGVPFRVAVRRTPLGDTATIDDLEAAPDVVHVDLTLNEFSIPLPPSLLQPARLAAGSVTAPHPVRYARTDKDAPEFVRLQGGATVRVILRPDELPNVDVIGRADPLDPEADPGLTGDAAFDPPHIFLGNSNWGVSVRKLTYDASGTFTPPEIVARSHGPGWTGVRIEEATLYFPEAQCWWGRSSIGVRDLLLGSPAGVQGEARLEFGAGPTSASRITFTQFVSDPNDPDKPPREVNLEPKIEGHQITVPIATKADQALETDTEFPVRVEAKISDTSGLGDDATVTWVLPSGDVYDATSTGRLTVGPTDTLQFYGFVEADGETMRGPKYTIAFTDAPDDLPPPPPSFRLQLRPASSTGGLVEIDAVQVSGSWEALKGLRFHVSNVDGLKWQLADDSVPARIDTDEIIVRIPETPGRHHVTLVTRGGQRRTLEFHVLEDGPLLVGGRKVTPDTGEIGVFDETGARVDLDRVVSTYQLRIFHTERTREVYMRPFFVDGTVADTRARLVGPPPTPDLTIPAGALADVRLHLGTAADPTTPPTPAPEPPPPYVNLGFDFNRPSDPDDPPVDIGQIVFVPDPETFSATAQPISEATAGEDTSPLRRWVDSIDETYGPDVQFIVVARCCDLGTDARNAELAGQRIEKAIAVLTAAGIDGDRILGRSERGEPSTGVEELLERETYKHLADEGRREEGDLFRNLQADGWLAEDVNRELDKKSNDPTVVERRVAFRRADVLAMVKEDEREKAEETHIANHPTARRRALVPGAWTNRVQLPPPEEVPTAQRITLRAVWDSPTRETKADWLPTLVEAKWAWESDELVVPGNELSGRIGEPSGASAVTPKADPDATEPEVFELLLRWSHDARSGDMTFTGAIKSLNDRDGLFELVSDDATAGKYVAFPLALGPALVGPVEGTNIKNGGATMLGIMLTGALAGHFVCTGGKVVVHGIEIQSLHEGGGSEQRLLVDYTAEIGIQVPIPGAELKTERAMRVRYRNVGLAVDTSGDLDAPWYERLSFLYDDVQFDVEDPGQWSLGEDGPLGSLLGIGGVRVGSGSIWIEVDLEFGLDLGPVTLDGATVRLSIDGQDTKVELRGLAVALDIPGTLTGAGSLKLVEGGFEAGLELQVIPAKLSVRGRLALQNETDALGDYKFVSILLQVGFPTPLPLASTGLGLTALQGRFVSNGARALPPNADALPDPVQAEIDWYAKPSKYTAERGQFAIGVGAVVGSLPDAGFSFNALGMLTIAFPDPSVVFTIDARFIKTPAGAAKEDNDVTDAALLGLIAVDDSAVKVGVRGSLAVKPLLEVKVPISGYFPFPRTPRDFFLRIGADDVEGRAGDPVTVTYLPGILDQRAWAYLMIEERKLHRLGGNDDLRFDGFAIGFGAGWEIDWSAGPISLNAGAEVFLGVGSKPLTVAGLIRVYGSLDLVVISVSASGEITFRLREDDVYMKAKFCGEVDCFFFAIKGCVSVTFDDSVSDAIPAPDSPLAGVDLTNRRAEITAAAEPRGSGDAPPVWIDTIPVLRFAHWVEAADTMAGSVDVSAPPAGVPWSGSSELKYAFRLTNVQLQEVRDDGTRVPVTMPDGATPVPGYWWQQTYRPGLLLPGAASGDDAADGPSEHESWNLSLLTWDLAPWARNLAPDADDAPGDPAKTIDRLCVSRQRPDPICIPGQNGARQDKRRVRLRLAPEATPRFSDRSRTSGAAQARASSRPFWVDLVDDLDASSDADLRFSLGARSLSLHPGTPMTSFRGAQPPSGVTAAQRLSHVERTGRFEGTVETHVRPETPIETPHLTLAHFVNGDEPPFRSRFCDVYSDLDLGPVSTKSVSTPNGGSLKEMRRPAWKGTDSFAKDGEVLRYQFPSSATVTAVEAPPLGDLPPPADRVPVSGAGGTRWLRVRGRGIRIRFPDDVREYRLRYIVSAPDGSVNAFEQTAAPGSEEPTTERFSMDISQTYVSRVASDGTSFVDVTLLPPAGSTLYLISVCVDAFHDDRPAVLEGAKSLPPIFGVREDGTEDRFDGRTRSRSADRSLLVVDYIPNRSGGRYVSFRIPQQRRTRIAVAQVCGTRWESVYTYAADEAYADALTDQLAAAGAAPGDPTPRPLLRPEAEYELSVDWQWQAWTPEEPGQSPPPPDSGAWEPVQTDHYRFRTAPAIAPDERDMPTIDDDRPSLPYREDVFDARDLSRYLIGLEPTTGSDPHFLDDSLRAHFHVQYVEQMLEAYGMDFRVRVRRTDPRPGETSANPLPDQAVILAVQPLLLDLAAPSDQRIRTAALDAQCIDEPWLGGQTLAVDTELRPRAQYDFELLAEPRTGGTAPVVVGRSHFTASAYADATALFADLGFSSTPEPGLPHDALVSGPLPGAPEAGDGPLETAMQDLGLDPWPLSPQPRTSVLWIQSAGTWSIAGVLLEGHEPIVRPGRVEIGRATLGRQRLHVARQNAARTRLLLTPDSSPWQIQLSGETPLELRLEMPGRSRTVRRTLLHVPVMAYQEGFPV